MPGVIDTDRFSLEMRGRSVDLSRRTLLIAKLRDSEQEQDLTDPVNCGGFGRVRHFRRETSPGWPDNPLPIEPAMKALGCESGDLLNAQVFQNASCNWRCWYCYVPFSLLGADPHRASWLSAADLIDLYLAERGHSHVIDLSGGQPDLVPEWIVWVMRELDSRALSHSVYLWSDDNLSNDYFWTFLTEADRDVIASYPMYGKVCCFKGFDDESFAFNTSAAPDLFGRQFCLMRRHVDTGIDVYGYATFTTPSVQNIRDKMRMFIDRLQHIHDRLPLRIVPLEVRDFSPVKGRMSEVHHTALINQGDAVQCWQEEIQERFPGEHRSVSITDIDLRV